MAQYRTAIIACGMIARVHTRGRLLVKGGRHDSDIL